MMKIIIILIVIILLTVIVSVLIKISTKGLSRVQAEVLIQALLDKAVKKNKLTGATILIDAPEWGLNTSFSSGEYRNDTKSFHIASAGKAFTASLIGLLIDEGKVSLNDKITDILAPGITAGLFVVDGRDYQELVTIGQLLNHTSGIADYFEDDAENTSLMQQLILNEPNRFWTPIDLINYTRDFQKPFGIPGTLFHYSDTGYILLGLIIEKISGKTFHELLDEKIFTPLEMKDSYLMFYSEPVNKKPLADIWLNGVNIKNHTSLSIDWAGGGIVSTSSDLAIFIRSLNNFKIISKQTLDSLYKFDEKFMRGIHYGYGFMEYHFGEFFPTLNAIPVFRGHMGVLGTQMFYNKDTDSVYISSFGSTEFSAGSVKAMIQIIGYTMRIKE